MELIGRTKPGQGAWQGCSGQLHTYLDPGRRLRPERYRLSGTLHGKTSDPTDIPTLEGLAYLLSI